MNYKNLIQKIVASDMQARRNLLLEQIATRGYKPRTQEFVYDGKTGCNVIAETQRNGDGKVVVTSHYDGAGVLDNAQGVAVTLGLMERLRNKKDITFLFTDLEEQGQLGARAYVQEFGSDGINYNVNVDGAGVGDTLIDMSKVKMLQAKLPTGEEAEIELRADSDVFREKGIPAVHYATLPENEIADLRNGRMPEFWRRHIYDDNDLSLISEKDIERTVGKIYGLIREVRK